MVNSSKTTGRIPNLVVFFELEPRTKVALGLKCVSRYFEGDKRVILWEEPKFLKVPASLSGSTTLVLSISRAKVWVGKEVSNGLNLAFFLFSDLAISKPNKK